LSTRRLELALTRERLLERSADVRERVAVQSAALLPALALGDRVRDVAYWLRTHPALAVSAFVVVVVVRPRIVWRWSLRAWSAWRFVRGWRNRLSALSVGR